MANLDVLRDTADTLVAVLKTEIPETLVPHDRFYVANREDLRQLPDPASSSLTVYVECVKANPRLRNSTEDATLPIEMWMIVTPWATFARDELRILSRIIRAVDRHPLPGDGVRVGNSWTETDTLQFVSADDDPAALQQFWCSLGLPFRPSMRFAAQIFAMA